MTFDFKRVVLALTAGSLLFGCGLTVSVLAGTQLAWAATPYRTIPVGSFPEGISSDGTHVWVADTGSNMVTELKTKTGSVVKSIPVGDTPIAVSSDGTHVWVANEGGDTVTERAV
jgi:YVTN family beta-propeller protein